MSHAGWPDDQQLIFSPASAKYLLVRLCLRKTEKWHRLSSLKYESELGDTILPALRELCGTAKRKGKQPEVKVKVEEPEIIDLTMDDEDDQPVAGPSTQRLLSPEILPPPPAKLEFLAEDSGEASLRELLECLSLPELKEVAVTMKVKHTTTVCARFSFYEDILIVLSSSVPS